MPCIALRRRGPELKFVAAAAVRSLLPRAKRRPGWGAYPHSVLLGTPPPDSALACAHAEPPSPPLASLASGRDRERAARERNQERAERGTKAGASEPKAEGRHGSPSDAKHRPETARAPPRRIK